LLSALNRAIEGVPRRVTIRDAPQLSLRGPTPPLPDAMSLLIGGWRHG